MSGVPWPPATVTALAPITIACVAGRWRLFTAAAARARVRSTVVSVPVA